MVRLESNEFHVPSPGEKHDVEAQEEDPKYLEEVCGPARYLMFSNA